MTKINHVAILVASIEDALPFWSDALGLDLAQVEDVPAEQAKVAFFPAGESEIELVEPTNSDTGLGRYLQKHGGGLHHICLEVPDISSAMQRLKEHQVELINEMPQQHRRRPGGALPASLISCNVNHR